MDNAELGEALLNLAKMMTEGDSNDDGRISNESRDTSEEDLSGSLRRLARVVAFDDEDVSREAAGMQNVVVSALVSVDESIDDPIDVAEEAVYDTLISNSRKLSKVGVHVQGMRKSKLASESREAADYDATDLVAKAYKMIVTAQPTLRKDKAFQKSWMPVVDWATDLDR